MGIPLVEERELAPGRPDASPRSSAGTSSTAGRQKQRRFQMDRHHSIEGSTGQTDPRSGFLCMGVLREILVVGLAVGLVMVFFDQTNTEVQIHLTPNRSEGARIPVRPVSILGLDC